MRDFNGLDITDTRQTMLMNMTHELDFKDQIDITDYFQHLDQIQPNTRCVVQIGLRYAWDSDVCPEFKIVVQIGKLSLISKQGLDDYPLTVSSAEMSIVVLDTTNMRILLTKSDTSITKFSLFTNSFINIDIV
jgi:hypothetical protein